jgi:hypothetical protein
MVTLMHYMENLPEWQAAEAVLRRMERKKYSLKLSDPRSDFSVLSENRRRYEQGDQG